MIGACLKSFAVQSLVPTRMAVAVLLVVCACLLSGCLKKTSRAAVSNQSSDYADACAVAKGDPYKDLCESSWVEKSAHDSSYSVRQQEARLIDIPIPIHADSLGFHEDQLGADKDSLVLAYRVHLKQTDIRSFFEIEMERLGWNMVANVFDVESMLVFIKPSKVCTVSLRNNYPQNESSLVVITYGNNKAGYSQE